MLHTQHTTAVSNLGEKLKANRVSTETKPPLTHDDTPQNTGRPGKLDTPPTPRQRTGWPVPRVVNSLQGISN
jgi:hypothetical protein